MIRSLVLIAGLILIAINYGIWTALGLFVFIVLILFLLAVPLEVRAEKKETIRRAKADYIEGAREYQQHYKAQLRNAQHEMRNALARAELCKRSGYLEDAAAAISCYEAWKPDAAKLEKDIAGFEKMERDAINNDGYLDLLSDWTPNKPHRLLSNIRGPSWEDWKEAGVFFLVVTAVLAVLLTCAALWEAAKAHAGERYNAAQTFTIAPVKPNPHIGLIPPDYGAPPPKPKYLILPPVEYDHPYEGKLTVETVLTRDELREICGKSFTVWTLGCAFRRADNSCRIVLVDETIIKAYGWTKALVMRHEIGHCNGWPSDHPGRRPHDAK